MSELMSGDIPKFAPCDFAKAEPFTNSRLFSLLPNIPKHPHDLWLTCFGSGSSFNGSNRWSRSGRHFYRNRWKLLGDLGGNKLCWQERLQVSSGEWVVNKTVKFAHRFGWVSNLLGCFSIFTKKCHLFVLFAVDFKATHAATYGLAVPARRPIHKVSDRSCVACLDRLANTVPGTGCKWLGANAHWIEGTTVSNICQNMTYLFIISIKPISFMSINMVLVDSEQFVW